MADQPSDQPPSVADASGSNSPRRPRYGGTPVSGAVDEMKFRKITVKTSKCQICNNKCAGIQCNKCMSVWCEKCRERNKVSMGHPVAHYNCEFSPVTYTGDANRFGWWIAGPPSYAANCALSTPADSSTTPSVSGALGATTTSTTTGTTTGATTGTTTGATGTTTATTTATTTDETTSETTSATNTAATTDRKTKLPVRFKTELEKLQEANIHGVPEIWGAEGLQRFQRARNAPSRFVPTHDDTGIIRHPSRSAPTGSRYHSSATTSRRGARSSVPRSPSPSPFRSTARKQKRRLSDSPEPAATKGNNDPKPAAKKQKLATTTSLEERPMLATTKSKPSATVSSSRVSESTAQGQKVSAKASSRVLPEMPARKPTLSYEAPTSSKKQYGPDGRRLGLPADAPSQGPKVAPKLTKDDISKVLSAFHTGRIEMPSDFVPPPGYDSIPLFVPPNLSAYGGGQQASSIPHFVPPMNPYAAGLGPSGGLGAPPPPSQQEHDEEDPEDTEEELLEPPRKK